MKKIPVGLLGATGVVGQQYVKLLADHPWFDLCFLASSSRSSGSSYEEAVEGRWRDTAPIPSAIRFLPVHDIADFAKAGECTLVFSAVTSEAAKQYEEQYASAGIVVVSNAGYHRQSDDVPVLIPEINPEHLEMIPAQQRNRRWDKGFIVTKPNCSLQSYMIPLHPLHQRFRVKRLFVTTLQAISGAGHSAVASAGIEENVVPFIANEEEKSESEPLKIWGSLGQEQIIPAKGIHIAAHCNRVPVIDGHLACVSVEFHTKPTREEVLQLWHKFQGAPQQFNLPYAPKRPIIYCEEADRPQPRLDCHIDRGMAVSVGRLRECPLLDYRFVALSHNTVRGAAGGGILNAELILLKLKDLF